MTPLLCLLLAGAPVKGAADGGQVKAKSALKSPALDPTKDTTPDALEQRALDEAFAQLQEYLHGDGGYNTPPPPPFQWKLSNILEDIEMPGIVIANGFPVKMHAFRVKASEEDVFAELIQNFNDQGLYLENPEKQAQPVKQNQVTALDYHRMISYTAFVEPHPDGTCTVMLGEANITEGLQMRERGGEADFAPVYPDAKGVMRTRAEGMDTLGYRTGATEAELLAFYKKNLEQKGYHAAPGNAFQKPGESIRLVARRIEGVLNVMLVRTSGRLVPAPATDAP